MKDAMEVITTKTTALRISTTSLKEWTLYGPIDQALKTSTQAKAVKGCSLRALVHDEPLDVVLWISAEPTYSDNKQPPNLMAMTMLALQRMRDNGEAVETVEGPMGVMVGLSREMMDSQPPVYGPAILTGAGGTDLPEGDDMSCIVYALMGQHD